MSRRIQHLAIQQSLLRTGREMTVDTHGWVFLRVCSGLGYVLSSSTPREMNPGDVVLIGRRQDVRLRASQLADLRVCHYAIDPNQLLGFFTGAELGMLGDALRCPGSKPRVLPREDPLSRHFLGICELRTREVEAVVRGEMLLLAVRTLKEWLRSVPSRDSSQTNPERRFAALVARIPESELMTSSASHLAVECACSERHLRRMFQQHFGVSPMALQIQWRVRNAKRLLRETDLKVIEVAHECGFTHLGAFNATFKRLTRFTPSGWRKQKGVRKVTMAPVNGVQVATGNRLPL